MYKSQYIALDSDTSFWKGQIDTLLAWHYRDIVDARELTRTNKIATYQQNKPNPFIIDTTLARRIYFPTMNLQEEYALDYRKERESCAVYDIKEKTLIFYSDGGGSNRHIMIVDMSGRIIMQKNLNEKILYLKDLSPGIYFAKVTENRKSIFSSKFVVI